MIANQTQMVANNKTDDNQKLLYKDLSYSIQGCFYEAYNKLGPAHKEQIYHGALCILFKEKLIPFVSRKRISIIFRGQKIGVYEPDFVIHEKIIIEIKSVLNMPKVFENQLYYYLRGSQYKVGYLVNFGNERLDVRRRIYDRIRSN